MRTLFFDNRPELTGNAGVGGKLESRSPAAAGFDVLFDDDMWGEDSFEKCERKMFKTAVNSALGSAGIKDKDIDVLFGGDLLNQIISASFSARDIGSGFLGLYGACSTMAESLLLSGALVNAGYIKTAVAATSSHFATAERQYRYPLELGTPKTPTSQITATAAGATVVQQNASRPKTPALTCATIGTVVDMGVNDANNMGAAMMPAALETIYTHFEDTGRNEDYYDLILTGDLGIYGGELIRKKGAEFGLKLDKYTDCGIELYKGRKEIYCGASGCGCSALMLNGCYLKAMRRGELKKLLFIATGALLSPTTTQQGETIPAVAHAVAIEMEG